MVLIRCIIAIETKSKSYETGTYIIPIQQSVVQYASLMRDSLK